MICTSIKKAKTWLSKFYVDRIKYIGYEWSEY
jgi:hypothetical protein